MRYKKNAILLAIMGLATVFSFANPTNTVFSKQSILSRNALVDDFSDFDSNWWHKADGYSNESVFDCGWRADHAIVQGGILTLRLDDVPCPGGCSNKDYASGEFRSNHLHHYGYYEVRLRAAKADGIVTSFFLYTDSWDGHPHDEIDIEILGKDTTKMQVNYWTNGVGGHETLVDLGFDAAADFHTYGINWTSDSIEWYVDDDLVHTEDGSKGALPTTPSRIMMNLWPGTGVNDWLNPFVYIAPLEAKYDWVTYDAPFQTFIPVVFK